MARLDRENQVRKRQPALTLSRGNGKRKEGEAGVGKTEVAKVLSSLLDARLIRLRCYEGLDVHNAVYEWAYARQILHLRVLEASGTGRSEMESDLYSREKYMVL